MKILKLKNDSDIHIVKINGSIVYKCIDKKSAEAIVNAYEALVKVWGELEALDDWGNEISVATIESIHKALIGMKYED